MHSRLDARVQLADLLAGIARRIASAEPGGRGDPGPVARLRPSGVRSRCAQSVRGDARSWSRPGPDAESPGRAAQINSGV
ncbi:hypothetical protein [Streptomyces sp. NPDC017958]|uniref:hypothetical protein n=1 Tax=Streptomyces sp. NPDC017958 TaxID=3365021 RepID=UPI0037AAC544